MGNLRCGPKGSRYFPSVERKGHVHRMHECPKSDIPTPLLTPGPQFYSSFRSRKLSHWVMAQSWFLTPLLHHICIKSSSCRLWRITASVCPAWMKSAGPQWALGFWPARPKEVIPGVQNGYCAWMACDETDPSQWPDAEFNFFFVWPSSLEDNFMEVTNENRNDVSFHTWKGFSDKLYIYYV